uniref:Uncharacterized protein n=1 Tax=Spongospora subterranea TaxID=70186 RepID=A0A0H5QQB0_9EUKA|eukprot:CRZ03651.1 hypothetical protein [Spongospora subterranea]
MEYELCSYELDPIVHDKAIYDPLIHNEDVRDQSDGTGDISNRESKIIDSEMEEQYRQYESVVMGESNPDPELEKIKGRQNELDSLWSSGCFLVPLTAHQN